MVDETNTRCARSALIVKNAAFPRIQIPAEPTPDLYVWEIPPKPLIVVRNVEGKNLITFYIDSPKLQLFARCEQFFFFSCTVGSQYKTAHISQWEVKYTQKRAPL